MKNSNKNLTNKNNTAHVSLKFRGRKYYVNVVEIPAFKKLILNGEAEVGYIKVERRTLR
jgi:hypothetical protein